MTYAGKNVVYSYAAFIVNVLTGLMLSVVLARNMTVSEFGQYSFLVSSITVLALVSSLGLDTTLQRYVAEYLVTKDKHKVGLLICYTSILRLMSISLVALVILLFYEDLRRIFHLTITYYDATIFLLIFFVNRFRNLIGTSLLTAYAKVYFDKQNFIFYTIIKLIFFYAILSNDLGIKHILLTWFLVETASLLIYINNAYSLFKATGSNGFHVKFSNNEFSRLINFSKTQALAVVLFTFADLAIDNIMLGYYVDQSAVARYSLAIGIVVMVAKINPVALMRPLFSTLAVKNYTQTNSIEVLKSQYLVLNKLTLLFCLPTFLILALHIHYLIETLYGVKYLDIIPLIYGAAIFFIFRELIHPVNPVINALEKNKLFLIASVFSIYNFVANIFLIPIWGEFGALASTGSAGVFLLIFYLVNLKKILYELSFPWQNIMRLVVFLLPVMLVHFVLYTIVDSFLDFLFVLLAEIITFLAMLTIFKYFNEEERTLVNSYIGKNLVWF